MFWTSNKHHEILVTELFSQSPQHLVIIIQCVLWREGGRGEGVVGGREREREGGREREGEGEGERGREREGGREGEREGGREREG